MSEDLRQLSRAALARAFDGQGNEWYELFEEAGELENARAALEPYRRALG